MSMPNPPGKSSNHRECAAYIKAFFAAHDQEVTVSTLMPLVDVPYEDLGMICPHGVRFYAEPTTDQILKWARDGVA